jgi:hypothetical protein
MRITVPREREREVAPGSYDSICYACVDLGTQSTPYGAKRQLYVAWELPRELNSQGKPFVVGKFYTLTGDARGALRQDLESWFGRVFDQGELEEIDLLAELIGRTGTLGLMHNTAPNGQIRARVTSIALPRRGTAERTATANAPITFGIEDGLDRGAYDALPEWLRTIVAKSPQYREAVAPKTPQGSTDERLKAHLGTKRDPARAAGTVNDLDDDLDHDITFIDANPAAEPIPVLRKRVVA